MKKPCAVLLARISAGIPLMIGLLTLSGCSGSKTVQPAPRMAGTVAYVVHNTDVFGNAMDSTLWDNSDGIIVRRIIDSALTDSTSTHDGEFEFLARSGTTYFAIGPTLSTADTVGPFAGRGSSSDIGRITIHPSRKSLMIYPNPTQASHGIALSFAINEAFPAHIQIAARKPSGSITRNLFDGSISNGLFQIYWDLKDDAGRFVPNGTYWVTLEPAIAPDVFGRGIARPNGTSARVTAIASSLNSKGIVRITP